MNLRKHWTILSRMVGDVPYTSSGLYRKLKNYHSSDLSARLNDMFHMGLIHMVKEKGKNIYFLTERGIGIACESDMIQYIPLLLAYQSSIKREKKLRSSQEESNVKKECKELNKKHTMLTGEDTLTQVNFIGGYANTLLSREDENHAIGISSYSTLREYTPPIDPLVVEKAKKSIRQKLLSLFN